MNNRRGSKLRLLFIAHLSVATAFAADRTPAQILPTDSIAIRLSTQDYADTWKGDHSLAGYLFDRQYVFNPATSAIEINGRQLQLEELALRGLSCKKAIRKCVSVKTGRHSEPFAFSSRDSVASNDFNLISLWQDEAYISNKICYGLLNAIGLISLRNNYAWLNLQVDGKTRNMGLYLATEKPVQIMNTRFKSPFVLRRGVNDKYEIEHPGMDDPAYARFAAKYDDLYTWARMLEGQELFDKVSERLDLNGYFGWLVFNTLVRNQDFQDEVFMYADPEAAKTGRLLLRVFPWDYDDVFQGPRKGLLANFKNLVTREDHLDRAIAANPIFQAKYREVSKAFLGRMSEHMIDEVGKDVRDDIEPYLRADIVGVSSELDGKEQAYDAAYIRDLIEERVRELKARRLELLAE